MRGTGRRARLLMGSAAVVTLMAAGTPPASALPSAGTIKSTFGTNTQGWRVVGDTASDATFVASGGNPGGYAQTMDQAVGGVMYWQAPAKFLGSRAQWYEGKLDFDLKQSATDTQFDSDDVVLTGGGITARLTVSPNPATTWTHYRVKLSETAGGWLVNGAPAMQANMRTVLGNLTDLRIRAEYRTGADTDGLDNVKLIPGPQASIANKSVTEGDVNKVLNVVIKLSAASAHAVDVSYATQPGSAASGQDYLPASGTVTFTPGQKSKTVPVTIVGDNETESAESFTVEISSPTVGVKGTGKATIKILDDDPAG